MNKSTKIIIGVIAATFIALIGVSIWQKSQPPVEHGETASYSRDDIMETYANIDYDKLDLNTIIPTQDLNGNIAENIEGPADAPVKIFEYADYQCSYCAALNPLLAELVEEYDGKLAVIFRGYILSYHDNGVIAASAANAAALQGYWNQYRNLLFANQNAWFNSTGDGLQAQLEQYFTKASDGKDDIEKFRTDMASSQVAQKVAFDMGAGDKMDIGGTPWLYLDGKWIENNGYTASEYIKHIRELVDQKLAAQK